jgi:hypothetical protein
MPLKVVHKDNQRSVALVKGTRKTFPVHMQKWLKNLVCVGDLAVVKKSPVSGEWIMTDYIRMWGDVDYEDQ